MRMGSSALAQLHRDVVFGRAGRKIIWQPRIGCWYTDKVFAHEPMPAPYTGMTLPQIYRELGCSARIYEFNAAFEAVEDPRVNVTGVALDDLTTEYVIHTPVGDQVQVVRRSLNNPGASHVKWPIASEEEMRVSTWRVEHTTWRWNQGAFDAVQAEWGDLGAPTMFMPRVNVQSLFLDTMGVENAIYAIYDWPATVGAHFQALEESHDRMIEVINASPIDIINFGDNLHCQTLPPSLFTKYVLPAYQHRCEGLHRAGKFVFSHWDGDTKALLPYAKDTGLDGIEAITPVPQGDVTLAEMKAALGDSLYLLDGIPAVYFDGYYPVETLVECTQELIALFAPRLVLGVSDEISSTGDLNRLRVVGEVVDAYNESVS